ncbi:MAG: cupredoxin domain-containing protein [Devosia sp.]|uniref:cupredoxin domain-containing protein n=1 Tax=Devosia sp. 66-22 TaxID=1895753 RepID=UPI000929B6C0|nr:cupredoxin domain-containing protein [Devosia sp. 66-22]MBN9345301.1 cupredoxin domain-containing protein [Devosia sp.]OJX51322.1 MAG: amicyanin [Devosia sp. 66-22]
MTALIKLALTGVLVAGTALAAMPAFAADYTIVIDKMKFGPVPAELHAGDTVIWQNNDIFRHSATARDKSFDVDLPAGTEVRMVVGAVGSLDFFCKFHPGMTGTLVIAP